MVENEIRKVSSYLQQPLGKLSYTEDNIIQLTQGSQKIVGFSTIINHFHSTHYKEHSTEDFFLTKQYFDFANVFIRSTSKRDKYAACLELNGFLETRTYLIGQEISLADVVVFYAISNIMKQLTPAEKDQFINLSRWFDHLQQQENIQQGSSPVNFSTIHLLGWISR